MSEQRILITGGTSGIGLATARRLASRGAQVAVLARNATGLVAARRQTAAAGRQCLALRVDVTDREALSAGVEHAVAELGGLDVAIANVSAATYGRFRDTPPEDFERVVDVTFGSAVDTTRAVLPHLEASHGSLVVVGSLASEVPLPRMSAYTASKHAVRGFVEVLEIELRAQGSNVAVSLVEPGPVDTPFWHNVVSEDGLLPPAVRPLHRPERVAAAIERSVDRRAARATVGRIWVLSRLAYRFARPLSSRLIAWLLSVAERRAERGPGRAAIWNPSGEGAERR
ncbi:MAG TPA: SDR family NAD(P)-dependent oxidoreductase [Solirubrobacterales bacterium]|nr:SDR family NAD(P)-dependent oxidoreductase [Solirubrobacterales bacterium]